MTSILIRQWYHVFVPASGMLLGWYLDRKETERLVLFRDKTALYGRELQAGEKPSWP
ncbi:unnamed protein product [Ceutorhynchus assimilis]|uniref:NADH dehydrogenase [ubiquinone] 1 beta subcomplex subunit 1 n=1 Tax=Ceutorhynchus assimilis TaxID=467358 RepID=A0A9N9QPD3_9CUCU|nr:unnamed protein product [Ceutorhynchus assimilis]